MESWRFGCGDAAFVLRRAPSLAFMEGRPYGHATEAALIEAARAKGVTAPEVVAVSGGGGRARLGLRDARAAGDG